MGITKVLDLRMKQVTYSYFSYSMATICSVWVPIVFPVQLARCFIPRRLTSLSADFYDLKTRKTENKASLDSKGYNQKPRLEQFLYNYVNKIKRENDDENIKIYRSRYGLVLFYQSFCRWIYG